MNLSNLLFNGKLDSLYKEKEQWEIRNQITKHLINLKDAILEERKANFDNYFKKVTLHPDWDNSKGWYQEHILGTPEHHIAELYVLALVILNSNKAKCENRSGFRILDLHIDFFMNADLNNIVHKANEEFYILLNIEHEIDNALFGMYQEYQTDLINEAFKLLGFCSIVSGNLGIDPMKYIKICLINRRRGW